MTHSASILTAGIEGLFFLIVLFVVISSIVDGIRKSFGSKRPPGPLESSDDYFDDEAEAPQGPLSGQDAFEQAREALKGRTAPPAGAAPLAEDEGAAWKQARDERMRRLYRGTPRAGSEAPALPSLDTGAYVPSRPKVSRGVPLAAPREEPPRQEERRPSSRLTSRLSQTASASLNEAKEAEARMKEALAALETQQQRLEDQRTRLNRGGAPEEAGAAAREVIGRLSTSLIPSQAADWRRAFLHAEIYRPPVALRGRKRRGPLA